MHARVVLGAGKGILFTEVSSFQRCPLETKFATPFNRPRPLLGEATPTSRGEVIDDGVPVACS